MSKDFVAGFKTTFTWVPLGAAIKYNLAWSLNDRE